MLNALQPWRPVSARTPRSAKRAAPKSKLVLGSGPAPRLAREPAPDALSAGELRALRFAFLGLVARWDLSAREALTLMGEPLEGEAERVDRLRALVGVGRLLLTLDPEREQCRALLRQPCPALGDAAPLQLMLAGGRPAIAKVNAHLAALAKL